MITPKQWLTVGALSLVAIFAYDLSTKIPKDELLALNEKTADGQTGHAGWKLYHPSNDRFEVRFPSMPQHASETHPSTNADETKYDVYLAQEPDGTVYMVSMTQYPESKALSKPRDLLEGLVKGAVASNSQNELIDSESITYYNLPAIEYVIQNSDFATKSKAILADNTLFVVTVMGRNLDNLESQYKEFAGSFNLKNTQPAATTQGESK